MEGGGPVNSRKSSLRDECAIHGVFGTEIFSPRFEFFGGSPNVLPSRYPSYYFPFSAAAETKITGLD